jgi:TonB family protein
MKQTLTDDEIEVYQNFDSIIKQTRAHSGQWVYYTGGAFVVAVLIVSIWWKNQPVAVSETVKLDEQVIPNIPEVSKPDLITLVDSVQAVVAEKQPLPKKKIAKPDAKTFSEEKPKPVGYKQAEPAGGYEKLYDYFNQELQYPESALRDSIQGVVVIDFVINVSGKPEQIQIQQSLDSACDIEAKRVIENMQPWLPASFNGKPVPARMSVPVTFQLLKPKQE